MFDKQVMQQILRLNLEDGRTIKSLSEEYGVSTSTISNYKRNYLNKALSEMNDQPMEVLKMENHRLKAENDQLKQDILHLKEVILLLAKDKKGSSPNIVGS